MLIINHGWKPRFLAALAFLVTLAVQSAAAADDVPASAAPQAGSIVLRSVHWVVIGKTKEWALQDAAEIDGDERFADRASFDAWVQERRQLLINERALASVEVDVAVSESDEAGVSQADLTFHVKDTWNVVALPYPKYDSNDGLVLSIKARDYNFMGTLEPLRLDFRYELEPDPFKAKDFGSGTVIMEIESSTPFKALGHDWEFEFDHLIGYTNHDGFEYENTTGLAVIFPIDAFQKETTLKVGAYHGISINEENDDEYKAIEGDRFGDYWYMSDSLEAHWTIPIRRVVGYGDLDYVPRSILNYNYRPGGDIGVQRRGPTFELGQKLTLGQVDWIDNFRKGMEASLDNANVYNLYDLEWRRSFKLSAAVHRPLSTFAGFSSRFTATWNLDKPESKAGSYLRGVKDSSVSADYAAYLNVDLPVRVIKITPSTWWPDKKWAKIFDFEQHWSPFMDFGFLASDDMDTTFSLDDALVTAGLAVITFPHSWRSLFVRISLGVNLREAISQRTIPDGDARELFIGVGHEY